MADLQNMDEEEIKSVIEGAAQDAVIEYLEECTGVGKISKPIGVEVHFGGEYVNTDYLDEEGMLGTADVPFNIIESFLE